MALRRGQIGDKFSGRLVYTLVPSGNFSEGVGLYSPPEMSERHGFLHNALKASGTAIRQYEAAQRRQAAAVARAQREQARQLRQTEALDKKLEREAQREHVREQETEAESLTVELDAQVDQLTTILSSSPWQKSFQAAAHTARVPESAAALECTLLPFVLERNWKETTLPVP